MKFTVVIGIVVLAGIYAQSPPTLGGLIGQLGETVGTSLFNTFTQLQSNATTIQNQLVDAVSRFGNVPAITAAVATVASATTGLVNSNVQYAATQLALLSGADAAKALPGVTVCLTNADNTATVELTNRITAIGNIPFQIGGINLVTVILEVTGLLTSYGTTLATVGSTAQTCIDDAIALVTA